MTGVGTSSTDTRLSPVYTAARILGSTAGGAATTSESRVGKKISQRSSGAFCSTVQLHQPWKYRQRSPHRGPQDPRAAESSVLTPHPIKLQRKSFIPCVGNYANRIKRNVPLAGACSHGGCFHFNGFRAGLAKFTLFGGSGNHSVN